MLEPPDSDIEATVLARIYRLILSWVELEPVDKKTADSMNLDGEQEPAATEIEVCSEHKPQPM